MQSSSQPLPALFNVFHSADHVGLVATCMSFNDLMAASSLCRSLHAVFDSEAVWQSRLRHAERIQHVETDIVGPAHDVLSATQLAALPPLPSLAEVSSQCVRELVEELDAAVKACQPAMLWNSFVPRPPPPRITAIVRLPSTLRYYARILSQQRSRHPLYHSTAYGNLTLAYSERLCRWTLEKSLLYSNSPVINAAGRALCNAEDNVGLDEESDNHPTALLAAHSVTSIVSSKQRYIELLQCSEHKYRGCNRLLPPTPPIRHSELPPLCPLPLCCLCRTVIARTIGDAYSRLFQPPRFHCRMQSVTRITANMYETTLAFGEHAPVAVRHITEYTRTVETDSKQPCVDGGGVQRYSLVAYYDVSMVYAVERNMCCVCRCGIDRSGGGHHESCKLIRNGSWSQTAAGKLL